VWNVQGRDYAIRADRDTAERRRITFGEEEEPRHGFHYVFNDGSGR
jgi:hypothetical protein